MEPNLVHQTPEAVRRGRKALALSLMIGGGACGIVGIVLFFVVGLLPLLHTTVYEAPVHVVVDCTNGTYDVYQQTGTQVTGPGFSFSHGGPATLTPAQVHVVGPGQGSIPTSWTSGSATITEGARIFSSVVGFQVSTPGRYSVTVTPSAPTAVIIGPSLGGQFLSAARWLILTGLGFVAGIVGVVLLIIDTNERRRSQMFVPAGWPPG